MGNHFGLAGPLPEEALEAIERIGPRSYFDADAWPEEAIRDALQVMLGNPYVRDDADFAAMVQDGIKTVGLRVVWQEVLDALKPDFERQRGRLPGFIPDGWVEEAFKVLRQKGVVAQPVE